MVFGFPIGSSRVGFSWKGDVTSIGGGVLKVVVLFLFMEGGPMDVASRIWFILDDDLCFFAAGAGDGDGGGDGDSSPGMGGSGIGGGVGLGSGMM